MHKNGSEANGSAQANQLVEDDKQVARDGDANGGQRGLLEQDGLVNDVQKVDVNGVSGNPDQAEINTQGLHPSPTCQIIHWERFLHVRTLKVLLVENDDSTRHIVSALLRNCSYEVIAVSNGLQAWKILEDINNQIDLVLSEVVMPGLSGIALLSKIMNHKTRKTTPVIMTSSHDSMGIVFKCLSKGAVDFLAKPIRKNELKNLWQHVWRKCHSSSGSGSESGVQNQKSLRSRSGGEDSENDSGSREEYDDRSIDLLRHDGSDNGSGTQSSWTKKAVDVESPQSMSPWESDPPDSTCAQVIHSRSEAFASSWVPTSAKENKGLDGQCENVATDKNLQVATAGSQNSLKEDLKRSPVEETGNVKNHAAPIDLKNDGKIHDSTDTLVGSENRKGDWMKQSADLSGVINSNRDTCKGTSESKLPFCETKDEDEEKAKDSPSLELTLKRVGDDIVRPIAPDQNTLRHSKLSAFTRYPDGSAAVQTPTGNVGSCSPVENSSDAAKTDSPQNLRSDTPPNQVSNGSSNNNDMGSTTYRSFTKPAEVIDKPSSKTTSSAVDCANPSVVQPVEDDKMNVSPKQTVLGGAGQEVQVQHHYHHYHHHHHHVHCLPQLNQLQKRDESSPKKMAPALECGSSCAVRRGIEVNVANCSRNGSASGSNHGSNLHNGSSTAAKVEGANMASDNWAAPEGKAGVGSGSGSGTGLDQDLSAQKEAALNKICQKRKERCFDKKVRYQSRKKPAEDRPRVRGQFVRQVQENKSKDADT